MNQGFDLSTRPEQEPPPPAQPQPMAISGVLQVTVKILRRRWAALLGVAALLVGPAALLTAATNSRFNEVALDVFPGLGDGLFEDTIALTDAEFERLVGAFVVVVLAAAFAGVLGTIAALGFSAVVGADYHGRSMDLLTALRVCLRRAGSALVIVLVTSLIIVAIIATFAALMAVAIAVLSGGAAQRGGPGVFVALILGVAMVIAVLYLTLRWALTLAVLAVEDRGWRGGLQRSWHLSGDNVWRTFAVYLVGALATVVLVSLVAQILDVILVNLVAVPLGLDTAIAEVLAVAVATVLLAPLPTVLFAVLYFDLRARRDPPGSIGAPSS